MNDLSKELSELLKDSCDEAIQNGTYEIECPKCNNVVSVQKGANICPHCSEQINIKLNIDSL